MSQPLPIVLAVAISLGCWFSGLTAAAAEAKQTLGRTIDKLTKKKELTIGYLGGSVSAGGGKERAAKSWPARVTEWFKRQFPDAKIEALDATLDGTGSEFAAFRCQSEISHKDADLVFVEFAVDDAEADEARVKRSIEGITRQIYQVNPWAEIVLVYATSQALASGYEEGKVPQAVGYHQAVARHYGIPEIDIGRAWVDRIQSGDASWEMLTTDGVHPSKAGTDLIVKLIETFLDAHKSDAETPPLIAMPEPLTKDPLSGAHLEDATALRAPGWRKIEKSPIARFPRYLECDQPGTELVHFFSGTTIGVLWLSANDGGDVEWSIDDGEPRRLSSWNAQAESPRGGYLILKSDLPSGPHTLKIKVHTKPSESRGNSIRISAFLVHCDC